MAVAGYVPTLGQRILLAMRSAGITQVQLAAAIGKNQSTVSRYVRDQVAIDVVTLQRIAVATGHRGLILDLTELPEAPFSANALVENGGPDLVFVSPGWSCVTAGQRPFFADEALSFN